MRHRLLGSLLIDLGIAAIVTSLVIELADSVAFTLAILGGVLILGGLAQLLGAWFLYPRSRDYAEPEQFGRRATATVIGVGHRGVGATGEQTARLRLRVSPANERPFTAWREVTLPDMPEVGAQVKVKFDPHRRRRLSVVESSAGAEPSDAAPPP